MKTTRRDDRIVTKELNVETKLEIAGVPVTATAAELNALDGITATVAELNIMDGVTASAAELNLLDGVTASTAELNIVDGVTATAAEINKVDGVTGYLVEAIERSFTETDGAGTYTGSVNVPAGATILDIIVNGVALWDNAGAVTMKVGDVADDDGYFTGIDLKATDLLAGESLSFALAGGKAGAYIANSQVSPRYSASARVVSGIIPAASTGGSTGRTRMLVMFALPTASAATKA
jgi:hypothetical protein